MAGFKKNGYNYVLSDNCKLRYDEKTNKPIIVSLSEVAFKYKGAEIDRKLDIVSIQSKKDKEEYLNYYKFFYLQLLYSVFPSQGKTIFITHLDMGYVPICYAPTYMSKKVYDYFIEKLEELNSKGHSIRRIATATSRLNGVTAAAEGQDIWCSKIDIARYQNCSLNEVKILEFIDELLQDFK